MYFSYIFVRRYSNMRTTYNGRNRAYDGSDLNNDKKDTGDLYPFNTQSQEGVDKDHVVNTSLGDGVAPDNFADEFIKEEEEFPALEENPLREMAQQSFIDLANAAYDRYHSTDNEQQDNYDNYNEEDFEEDEVPQKKKLPTWAKVLIIIGSIVLAVALVVGSLFMTGKLGRKQETPDVDIVSTDNAKLEAQSKIDKLYTDNLKADIKDGYTVSDLDVIKDILKSLDEKESKEMLNELKTIETYMTDIKKVNRYADLGYNIEPDYVGSDLRQALANSEGYTVAGLKATMASKIKEIMDDRDSYLGIKGELKLISDPTSYNETLYKTRISAIKHTVNKADLQSMSDKLVAEKELAKAEKAVKDAEDKKAKEEAQASLKAAQEKQKEMESQLAEAQKALEEAQKQTDGQNLTEYTETEVPAETSPESE